MYLPAPGIANFTDVAATFTGLIKAPAEMVEIIGFMTIKNTDPDARC